MSFFASFLWLMLSEEGFSQIALLSIAGGVSLGLMLAWFSYPQWDALTCTRTEQEVPVSPQFLQRSLMIVILAPSIINALFGGTSNITIIGVVSMTMCLVYITYHFLSLLLAPLWYRHVQKRDPRDS